MHAALVQAAKGWVCVATAALPKLSRPLKENSLRIEMQLYPNKNASNVQAQPHVVEPRRPRRPNGPSIRHICFQQDLQSETTHTWPRKGAR